MCKRVILMFAFFCCCWQGLAQSEGNFILGVETGVLDLSESQSIGLFLNVEPKVKVAENSTHGLRIGFTLNSQTIENADSTRFNIRDQADNGTFSFIPTFEYRWNRVKRRPYLAAGLGYFVLGNPIEFRRIIGAQPNEGVQEARASRQIGFLVRGGAEFGKVRLGLDYNFVPKPDIKTKDGETIGKVDLSYLGLSIGFELGG